ncbi:MAG TPA: 30S ribosomal protein S9 [Gemmataceae bacterium]
MAETKTKPPFYRGTGRRKTAVARVRVQEGSGRISVNGRELDDYFTEEKDRAFVLGPLLVTDLRNRLDVIADVRGGGITGQAGAVSQGLARAIKVMFAGEEEKKPAEPSADGAAAPEGEETGGAGGLIKKLRDSGYLTRDSRMKERKKYGRKGARRSFQFSKR